MTPTEQAAKLLADVPTYSEIHDAADDPVMFKSDAIAAIARHLAPGDDLVERATAALQGVTEGPWKADGEPWNQIVWSGADNRVCFMAHSNGLNDNRDVATARFIAFARDWVPESAARISALTATVAEAQKRENHAWEMVAKADTEVVKAAADRIAAMTENATLRERLARMEGALIDAVLAWDEHNKSGDMMQGGWVQDARAALTDGGSNG